LWASDQAITFFNFRRNEGRQERFVSESVSNERFLPLT
jgi:hypothetical protein